jgi:hypothetical protein
MASRRDLGPDVAAALDWVGDYACTKNALGRLDPVATAPLDTTEPGMSWTREGDRFGHDSRAGRLS